MGAEDMFEDIVSNIDKPFRARGRDPGLSTHHLFHFFDATLYTRMDDSKYVRPTHSVPLHIRTPNGFE